MILDAYYSTIDHITVEVIHDDRQISVSKYTYGQENDYGLNAWIDAGNTIRDYNQYNVFTDDQLREQQYFANARAADEQIKAAEHTPEQGVVLDDRGAEKANGKRNNRSKRNSAMTDQDDAMADYVDGILDELDQYDDTVENLNRAELEVWDASTLTWSSWIPPI